MAIRIQLRRDTAANWVSSNPVLRQGEIGIETDTLLMKLGNGTSSWTQITGYMNLVPDGNLTIGDYVMVNDIGASLGVVGLDSNKNALIPGSSIIVEGATDNSFETTITVTDPTADRTITLPDATGTVALTSDISTAVNNLVDGAPTLLNTLNELAAAINDDANYTTTITTALGTKAPIDNPSFTGTVAGVTKSHVGLGNVDNTSDDNKPVSTATQTALNLKADTSAITELAQDAVNSAIVAGTGLDKAYNDEANTITLDIDSTVATKAFAAQLLTNATKSNIVITGDETGITITAENGVADSTTDSLTEGSTNKYFTDERAQDAVGNAVGTGLSYNDTTGAISVDTTAIQAKVANVTDTEIGYLDGVTSAIQTQINAKAADSDLTTHTGATEAHGATGAVVGTTNTQTLTNKTLTSPVINTPTGITKSDIGLANVDNTSDANKPVSTATQTALDAKLALAGGTMSGEIAMGTNKITGLGAPTNANDAATKTYVDGVITNLVDGAPDLLNTLNELAAAINDDANYSTTLTTALGNKQDKVAGVSDTEIGYLDGVTSAIQTQINTKFNFSDASTTNISEGTSLYFTNERAQDAIGDNLGTGLSYNDTTGAISVTTNTYDAYGSASIVAGNLSTHELDTTTHGTTGNIVGTSDIQTLTNKTLTSPVINTPTGITKSDVGLANVDNTSDANKSVSTATQTALDLKAATDSPIFTGTVTLPTGTVTSTMIADGTILDADINASAAIALSKLATDPLARANHTGSQAASTISDFNEAAQDAIGTILGTGLSYNDAGNGIGINYVTLGDTLLDGVSGASYGLIGTSTYLDIKNTNGYNKEIELDITAVKTQLNTDGYLTTSSTSTLTNKTLTSPKINEDVAVTATATELNILDGATLTTTELNYVDGVTSAIQTQIDNKLSLSGGTMTGALTLSGAPSSSLHAATKQYVDNTASGIVAKPQVLGATTLNLDATYNNGTAGVGATLTHNTNGALPSTSGGATGWAVGKGILVKNQTNKAENGRYYVSDMGSPSTPYVLTRCGYCDEASEIPGSYIFVQAGTSAGTGWVQSVADASTFTVGTDDINIYQFSGSGTYTAGTGLTLTGNEYSINTSVTADLSTAQTLTNKTLTSPVVNTPTGITKSDVGLANVDNTTDAEKPISTATQTALDLKAPLDSPAFTGTVALTSTVNGPNATTSVNLLSTSTSANITLGAQQTAGNLTIGGGTQRTTGVIGIGTGATTTGTKTINVGTGSTGGTTEITIGSSSGATSNITLNGDITLPSTTSIGDVSSTELSYVNGVTSAIQTQLDGKVDESLFDTKGDILVASADNTPAKLAAGTNGYLLTANSAATNGVEWAAAPVSLPAQNSTLTINAATGLSTPITQSNWSFLSFTFLTATTFNASDLTLLNSSFPVGSVLTITDGTDTQVVTVNGAWDARGPGNAYVGFAASSMGSSDVYSPTTISKPVSNSGKYLTTDGSTASWGTLVVPISTGTVTVNQNTAQNVDTIALSAFTSAEYMVSIKQGSKIRTSKVLVHTDGTSVDSAEFGIMEMGGAISGVNVAASVSSTNSILTVTITNAVSTNATVKITKTVV
jgi:hypothetical protein